MKSLNHSAKIHPSAEVKSTSIGRSTYIWQFSVVLAGATIGDYCNINCHTFIENDVVIGDYVTVKSGVYLWDGITVANHVFIGPNVTFTNDLFPRSKVYPDQFQRTLIGEGASIGANATIIGGVTIGRYALIGAGSLVTKDVPDFALVYGSPGKIQGWVDKYGNKLKKKGEKWINNEGEEFFVENGKLRFKK
jgi:acetyltransferase-like isoleucine patch superfamily enzyme